MDLKEKTKKKLYWYIEEIEMWELRIKTLTLNSEKTENVFGEAKKTLQKFINTIDASSEIDPVTMLKIIGLEYITTRLIKEIKTAIETSIVSAVEGNIKAIKIDLEQFKNKFQA